MSAAGTQNSIDRPEISAGSSARLLYLDALRGLLLVIMAVNHVPNGLQPFTDHPLGFMSAAEGFVFLSGLMAGLVYTRRFLQHGLPAMRRGCLARAAQIYRQHLLIYFSVFALVLLHLCFLAQPPPNAPVQMVSHPWRAIFVGPLLLSQPSLLDILPFYCAFMLLCPWLVIGCENGHRFHILLASFFVWIAANIATPQTPILNTPTFNSGAFNLFAWQLLFVAGAIFGHAMARKQKLLAPPRLVVALPLVILACLLFAVRHAWIQLPLPVDSLSWLTNKNNLAPLRLLNTALVFWLVHAAVTRWPRVFNWRPLAFLGRHSLAVFSAHVLVAYILLAHPSAFAATVFERFASGVFLLAAMFVTAALASHLKSQKRLSPPSLPTGEDRPRLPQHRKRTAREFALSSR